MTGALVCLAIAGLVLGGIGGAWDARFWISCTLLGTLSGLGAAATVLVPGQSWTWRGPALGGEQLFLYLDGLSALFLVLVCLVGGLGALYSMEYWSEKHAPRSAARGRVWWNCLVCAMAFVLLCANGLHFLLAWELFAVSAYFLITLNNAQREVRKAGWLYLAASHTGTMVLFAFFCALAAQTGSWELGPMRDHARLAPLFWLALAGFGVKAGLFPLHIWLPSAHANAPSHVSAIMSAVAIKMGVYGIIRFSGWLPVSAPASWTVLWIGAISALLGIVFAAAQTDIKRLLAYCSVENVGIILAGLGLCLVSAHTDNAPWGQVALGGALLHTFNHCVFKSLLFFGAGAVLHATGTRNMSRLGGLWKPMPWTAGSFLLGAAAVAALPPCSGFASEWMLYLGFFQGIAHQGPATLIPIVILLAAAGALALAAFLKVTAILFLGAPRTKPAIHAKECGWTMRAAMVFQAGLVCLVGLFPAQAVRPLLWIVDTWGVSWISQPQIPVPALGQVHRALFLLLLGVLLLAPRFLRRRGLRRSPTWDCGYAVPTARMQYTGASFSEIAARWFSWILQPQRLSQRVRGYFPRHALLSSQIPETVLEKIVVPSTAAVLALGDGAVKMQHGRLHLYILYIFAGLSVTGFLVFLGGL